MLKCVYLQRNQIGRDRLSDDNAIGSKNFEKFAAYVVLGGAHFAKQLFGDTRVLGEVIDDRQFGFDERVIYFLGLLVDHSNPGQTLGS